MLFPKIQFPGSLSISTACSILGKWPLSRSTRLPPSSPREKILYRARAAPRVIGLIIAGIFAAAMGSLSSSLNSVAAIAASDFLGVLRPDLEASHGVTLGRWVTFAGGLFATLMAMWVASLDSTSLWDQAVRLLALFGGPLPGVFALGMLTRPTACSPPGGRSSASCKIRRPTPNIASSPSCPEWPASG